MKKLCEFSKIIFILVTILTVYVTISAVNLANRTNDTSVYIYLIPAVFAELATATGFYYVKAKAENNIKLRKKYGAEIYNDTKGDF